MKKPKHLNKTVRYKNKKKRSSKVTKTVKNNKMKKPKQLMKTVKFKKKKLKDLTKTIKYNKMKR